MNFEIDIERIKADAAKSFKKEAERKIIEQATEKAQELFISSRVVKCNQQGPKGPLTFKGIMNPKVCRECKHHSSMQVDPKNKILNAIYQFLCHGNDYCRKNAHTNTVNGTVMNGPCKLYRGYGRRVERTEDSLNQSRENRLT